MEQYEKILTAIIEALPNLPERFSQADVMSKAHLRREAWVAVREVLDGLVARGTLHVVPFLLLKRDVGRRGRITAAWSQVPVPSESEVIQQKILAVLDTLPVRFSLRDVSTATGLPAYRTKALRTALEALTVAGRVLPLAEVVAGLGRPPKRWSAHSGVMAENREFYEAALRGRNERTKMLARLLQPFDPFDGTDD